MELTHIVVVLLLCLCLVIEASISTEDDYTDFKQLMKILSKPRMLDRYMYSNEVLGRPGKVQAIQWNNCGASSDPLQLESLKISPDPIKIPGNISLSAAANTSINLKAPIEIQLTLKKKILFWIEIPCIDNIGSCTYSDICILLATVTCPSVLTKHGINCRCPYSKGNYSLPMTAFTIPSVGLPDWLEEGEYQATAKLSTNGQPLGCLFAQLSLTRQ